MMRKKKKILIADDDPAIVEVIELILTDAGYEVETTTDGHALQALNKNFPDLILLDIRMSGTDGSEICEKLKKQEATKHIPIILISANKDGQQIADDVCADDFIAKPFEMDQLLSKVAQYMDT